MQFWQSGFHDKLEMTYTVMLPSMDRSRDQDSFLCNLLWGIWFSRETGIDDLQRSLQFCDSVMSLAFRMDFCDSLHLNHHILRESIQYRTLHYL